MNEIDLVEAGFPERSERVTKGPYLCLADANQRSVLLLLKINATAVTPVCCQIPELMCFPSSCSDVKSESRRRMGS